MQSRTGKLGHDMTRLCIMAITVFTVLLALPASTPALAQTDIGAVIATTPRPTRALRFQTEIAPISGSPLQVGVGYDSLNAQPIALCVDPEKPMTTSIGSIGLPQNDRGQSLGYHIYQSSTLTELRRHLSIDASAAFGFGMYHGGGSYHFLDDYSFNSASSYVVIDVAVINQTRFLKIKTLRDVAKNLMGKPDRFRAKCGDSFVSGFTTGGAFQAVMRFEAASEVEKRELDSKIDAGVSSFLAGNASFSEALKRISQVARFKLDIIRKGDNSPIPDVDALIEYARNFPTRVDPQSGQPWIVDVTTEPYEATDDYDSTPSFDYPNIRSILEILARLRDEAIERRNQAVYVVAHPDDYLEGEATRASAAQVRYNDFLRELSDVARACAKAAERTACEAPAGGLPDIPKFRTRMTSMAPTLEQADALFARRGLAQNVNRAIEVLNEADFTKATPTENYRRSVLLARLHLWNLLNFGTPEGKIASANWTRNPKYTPFHDAAVVASTLGESLGGVCEGRYLKAVDAFIAAPEENVLDAGSTPGIIAAYRAVAAQFERAMNTRTIDGAECRLYDSGGVDRHWGQVLQWLQYGPRRNIDDARRDYAASLAHLEGALAIDPNNVANVRFLGLALHLPYPDVAPRNDARACQIFLNFGSRPPDSTLAGLEPELSHGKAQVLVLHRMICK